MAAKQNVYDVTYKEYRYSDPKTVSVVARSLQRAVEHVTRGVRNRDRIVTEVSTVSNGVEVSR
jgi:hypothetical protein